MRTDSGYSFKLDRANNLVEKTAYIPTCDQEGFIVPVLKYELDELIEKYATVNQKKARVLDVGCGRQPFRNTFETKGYQYLSLDTQQSPESSVDFICEIDQLLPREILDAAPFDFIFCTEVLEHVADWEMTFRNFYQLLAPGGKLLITCPHFYPLHEVPYDFWRPTPYALQYYGNKFELNLLYQKNAGSTWDVLGTILGASHTVPISRRFADRLISRIAKHAHQILLSLLLKRFLQSHVQLNSSLYLANIAVFEK
jgi:SAM-dependent methyltransferase